MEQLSNYQSAHVDYIGSDALSTALAVAIPGPSVTRAQAGVHQPSLEQMPQGARD